VQFAGVAKHDHSRAAKLENRFFIAALETLIERMHLQDAADRHRAYLDKASRPK
jgi:hypothetical protein